MTKIDITLELKRFEKHLKNNPRTIFSAKFGDGKTYFLNAYRKKHEKDTLFVVLHPINYSVATNEDIFEYIKRDILVELSKEPDFNDVDWDKVAKDFFSVNTFLEVGKAAADGLKPDFIIKPTAKALLASGSIFKKTKDKYSIESYFGNFSKMRGGVYEQDLFTAAIKAAISKIQEQHRKCVLIIEDLDRIDPGHLFRILNVLGAHIDEDVNTNKFGFDNIVAVLDYEITRHIFYHFYSKDANYDGYMAKFICQNIFEYSIIQEARNQLMQYIRDECKLDDFTITTYGWDNDSSKFDEATISRKIKEMSVRDIVRVLDVKNIVKEREVTLALNRKVSLQDVPVINLLGLFMRMDFKYSPNTLVEMLMNKMEHFKLLGNSICMENIFNGNRVVCNNAESFTVYFHINEQQYVEAQFMQGSESGMLQGPELRNAIMKVLPTLCTFVNDCKVII